MCNHYYITLFITITSDVLIKIFKNLIIFLVCGFQGTYLTNLAFASSVIRTLNLLQAFKTLITGKTSLSEQHFPADRVGGDKLLLILACIYDKVVLSAADLPFSFFNLAATYSPTPSPVQYHRPLAS